MNSHSKFIEELLILEQELFTGIVTIITFDNKQWEIYLYQGRLIWATGGSHIYRFWQRHLKVICPQADIELFEREIILSNDTTDYYFINTLLKYKLATREQIHELIKQKINNVFFDIFQAEYKQSLKIKTQAKSAYILLKNNFNLTLSPLSVCQFLSKTYGIWSKWQSKGLTSCSPNLAPILKQQANMDRQVSSVIWQNMQRMLNGKNTLRDLALQMDKDVFEVTCALIPYFFKGYIRLVEIPDLTGVGL